MWKPICCLTGGVFAALASLCTISACFFVRFEEAGELERLMFNDVVTGGMFAVAFILLCAPLSFGAARWRLGVVMAIALVIWVGVSVSLIRTHKEQFRIRVEESTQQNSEPSVRVVFHRFRGATLSSTILPKGFAPAFGNPPMSATTSTNLRDRFLHFAAQWKQESIYMSNTAQMAMLRSYQNIIGMGAPAVPLLLEELQREPDHWFWALEAITLENPVPLEARGKIDEMAKAWIDWGRQKGYIA